MKGRSFFCYVIFIPQFSFLFFFSFIPGERALIGQVCADLSAYLSCLGSAPSRTGQAASQLSRNKNNQTTTCSLITLFWLIGVLRSTSQDINLVYLFKFSFLLIWISWTICKYFLASNFRIKTNSTICSFFMCLDWSVYYIVPGKTFIHSFILNFLFSWLFLHFLFASYEQFATISWP